MLRLTLYLISLTLTFAIINCKFNNIVKFIPNKRIYKYELHFTDGLSMSINNIKNGEFDPVDFNISDGKFYARDKDTFHACNLSRIVTDKEELDSIMTLDGRHRSMIFVNNQFPGPSIVVEKDAQVEVEVHNHFRAETLSVHWHGQTQKNSFQMDGVSRITQCGIAPGESFSYRFIARDVGTHWYHSHSSVQRTDGAIGAFIVIDPKSNNFKKYNDEFYFFVQDWQLMKSEESVSLPIWGITKFWNGLKRNEQCFLPLRIKDASMMMLKPDSFIINGKGWHDLPLKIDQLESFTSTAAKLPLERFKVKSNGKYLFRVIGSNMGLPLMISVNGHKINLVSSDGNQIEPINDLDYVIINGGERYDFELITKEFSDTNFFIIIQAVASFDYNFSELNRDYYGVSILEYENTNNNLSYFKRECTKLKPCLVTNCPYLSNKNTELKCIRLDEMKSSSSVINEIEKTNLLKTNYKPHEFEEYFFNFHFSGEGVFRSSINGKQYKLPNMPPFFVNKFEDAIKGGECKCVGEETCHCSSLTQITPGKVIQFVLYNMGKGAGVQGTAHPIHLHGHHFYLLSLGYPTYHENNTYYKNNKDLLCKEDDSEFCNNISWSSESYKNGNVPNANLLNPIKKDTILVPVGGYAVVRFISDNIGYWFMHCHVEVHATEGMGTLIREGTHEEIRSSVDWNDMHSCSKGFTTPVSFNNSVKNSSFNIIFYLCLILIKNILIY